MSPGGVNSTEVTCFHLAIQTTVMVFSGITPIPNYRNYLSRDNSFSGNMVNFLGKSLGIRRPERVRQLRQTVAPDPALSTLPLGGFHCDFVVILSTL